jgi:hypothetical protein
MNALINALTKSGLLKEDLDYHLVRASMVILFLFFGYQKWFEYEAKVLVPFISNGPLISWLYPIFGVRGASWFLGVAEWLFCALLFPRFGFFLHRDHHHHSLYAGWMGPVRRRISRNDRQRCFPHEGRGASRGVGLFAEAGCRARSGGAPAAVARAMHETEPPAGYGARSSTVG